jgi:hypothetical protein
MITIELEDKGQDFTRWTCDETGEVVKCEPFQGWLWEGMRVLNPAELRPGEPVDFLDQKGKLRTLAYRVVSVRLH